ncbi:MAG: tRNA pseudouridine(38-40) synthase TruA [Gammaproteobacteria bacterium]|nr:tRNA pseudouridine(38-40) synthase TruA [Gammaproteobacteria bacterium]MDH3412831.1 tRNA pseudouridine(38-40) synthase TruA [Gammaproteobacteria bacterium]
MKIALGLEYDGREFHGFETQPNGRTVQACLEAALSRVADQAVKVICAGRTDAGVHALGQIVHFVSQAERPLNAWVFGANSNLPEDVSVNWSRAVPEEFHARFSATARRYRYLILNRATRPATLRGRVSWEYRPLEVERMQAASGYLLGEHDFSSFRGAGCQSRSPRRRIYRLEVSRRGPFVLIDVTANAFLQHMVRNIAGVLMDIGAGKSPVDWAEKVLRAADRRQGGVTAPPDGLYLAQVDYPAQYRIPAVPPESGLW